MDNGWNERLKSAREKASLTLKEVSDLTVFDVSQQSLIKYEKGAVFPRIDLLDKMCKKYNVTVDYILYGSSELSKTNDVSGQLVSLFALLHAGSLSFDKKGAVLKINDRKLLSEIEVLDIYIRTREIASIDDLSALIKAIKTMESEP